jgi:hypothetical protein
LYGGGGGGDLMMMMVMVLPPPLLLMLLLLVAQLLMLLVTGVDVHNCSSCFSVFICARCHPLPELLRRRCL